MNICLKSTYISVQTSTTAPECIFNLCFTMQLCYKYTILKLKSKKSTREIKM